jgi:hypothetical protein
MDNHCIRRQQEWSGGSRCAPQTKVASSPWEETLLETWGIETIDSICAA